MLLGQIKNACKVAFQSTTTAATRNQAVEFLNSARDTRDGVIAVLALMLDQSENNETLFWSLKSVDYYVQNSWERFTQEERCKLRDVVLRFVTEVVPKTRLPTWVLNKTAVVLVRIFCLEYPKNWPSFLTDVSKFLVTRNLQAVELFFLVFLIIDEDVVRIRAGKDENQVTTEQSAILKDAMRVSDVQNLCELWYKLVATNFESNPSIALRCLEVVDRYVHWIDIGLLLNERWFPLIVSLLEYPKLRNAAVDVLYEIVLKKMDVNLKLRLLKDTRMLEIVKRTNAHQIAKDYASKVSGLNDRIGQELLACVSASVKGSVELLDVAVDLSFPYFKNHWVVSNETLDFFLKYWAMVKREEKKLSPSRQEVLKNQFEMVLVVIAKKIRIPEDVNPSELGTGIAETEYASYRMELDKLLRTLVRIDPRTVISFAKAELMKTINIQVSPRPYAAVEASLHIIYQVGEYMGKSNVRIHRSIFVEIIDALVESDFSRHPHFAVSMEYFNLMTRYVELINKKPQQLKNVIESFCDERGLGNETPRVRTRCAYLLTKFLQKLELNNSLKITEYAEQQGRYLFQHIRNFADHQSRALLASNPSLSDSEETDWIQYVLEAVGWLLRPSILGIEKSRQLSIEGLKPLVNTIEIIIQKQSRYIEANPDLTGIILAQLVSLIGCFTKPFTVRDGKVLRDIFHTTLDRVISAFAVLPTHAALREKSIFFLYRMVSCIGEEAVPHFQMALKTLWGSVDSENIVNTFNCTTTMILKLKKAVAHVISENLATILKISESVLEEFSNIDTSLGAAESHRICSRVEIQKQFYGFISGIIKSGIGVDVLSQPNKEQQREKIIRSLIHGCRYLPPFSDLYMNQLCFSTLDKMVDVFSAHPSQMGFSHSVLEEIISQSFSRTLSLSPKVNGSISLLRDITNLQITIVRVFQDPQFLSIFGICLTQKLTFSTEQAREYCILLQKGDSSTVARRLLVYIGSRK